MIRRSLLSYVRTHRKRWALPQKNLAFLLGIKDPSLLSRFERHERHPPLKTAFKYEVIFGEPLRSIFRGLYDEVEEEVMARALKLHERLEGRTDPNGLRKRKLLCAMLERATKRKGSQKHNKHA